MGGAALYDWCAPLFLTNKINTIRYHKQIGLIIYLHMWTCSIK